MGKIVGGDGRWGVVAIVFVIVPATKIVVLVVAAKIVIVIVAVMKKRGLTWCGGMMRQFSPWWHKKGQRDHQRNVIGDVSNDGEKAGEGKAGEVVRVTWFAGVGCVGVFVGVGGVEGRGIWSSVTGVTLQKKWEPGNKREKRTFSKLEKIQVNEKKYFVVLEINCFGREKLTLCRNYIVTQKRIVL